MGQRVGVTWEEATGRPGGTSDTVFDTEEEERVVNHSEKIGSGFSVINLISSNFIKILKVKRSRWLRAHDHLLRTA